MPSLDPEQRSRDARLAAYVMHSQHDAVRTTAKARQTFLERFEREVDPGLLLAPEDRARRAKAARSVYFRRLAAKSALARRRS